MSEICRIVVVDDHPLFRRGLKELLLLEPTFSVVGEAGTREEAIAVIETQMPDLVVLDLNLKESSGVEILSHIKSRHPEEQIVILTVSDAEKDLAACIAAGADGYFLKDMEPEDLLNAIKASVEGQFMIDSSMKKYLSHILRSKETENKKLFTEREEDVLKALAAGFSNKVIARELSISEGTVKSHVKHILQKLEFKSRVEVAVWATSQGYLTDNSL